MGLFWGRRTEPALLVQYFGKIRVNRILKLPLTLDLLVHTVRSETKTNGTGWSSAAEFCYLNSSSLHLTRINQGAPIRFSPSFH